MWLVFVGMNPGLQRVSWGQTFATLKSDPWSVGIMNE